MIGGWYYLGGIGREGCLKIVDIVVGLNAIQAFVRAGSSGKIVTTGSCTASYGLKNIEGNSRSSLLLTELWTK